jgi:hypothetical protein
VIADREEKNTGHNQAQIIHLGNITPATAASRRLVRLHVLVMGQHVVSVAQEL